MATIRLATADDAAALIEISKQYIDTPITFEYDLPGEEEFAARMAEIGQRYPYLVAERPGADGQPHIVGYVYASPFKARPAYDWAVETSIYVDRAERRSGVGRALHNALERCLVAQGILNMEACIATTDVEDEHLTNDSWRFHEHMGYRLVGEFRKCGYKYGRWWNMIWMPHFVRLTPSRGPDVWSVRAIFCRRSK